MRDIKIKKTIEKERYKPEVDREISLEVDQENGQNRDRKTHNKRRKMRSKNERMSGQKGKKESSCDKQR